MKRFLYSLTAASITAVVVLTVCNPVSASDKSGSDPTENAREKDVSGQSSSQDEVKGASLAKLNIDSDGLILKGCDAVAYFKQGKAVKGDPAILSTYQGATYLFASASNKAEFDKNPAKYAPQYGGFCAYGVTNGVLADPEGPNAFAVYKGKLYVCGNQGALRSFKSDIAANIEKADLNWLQLAKP